MGIYALLTWSLLTSAVFILITLVVRRAAVARYGALPPPTTIQVAFVMVASLLVGALLTALTGEMAGNAALVPWTRLLTGVTVATMGLYNLHRTTRHGGMRFEPLLSKFCLGAGLLMILIGIFSLWEGR